MRLGRFRLDRALAAGARPSSSPRLARRAERLCRTEVRSQVADDIEGVLEAAAQPPRLLSASVPLNRRAIDELRPLLLTLADDLRAADSVDPQGVAIALQLLMDGDSPLYRGADPGELEEELRRARAALLPA